LKIRFTESAARDLEFWRETHPKTIARIRSLLDSIRATPFDGIGKPESLKHDLAGYWSRRINREHRLVYRIEGEDIIVIQCRFHY
jgi:toxin YoeB